MNFRPRIPPARPQAKRRVAKTYTYAKNVRHDFAHKVSRALVSAPGVRLVVMEDLKR